MVAPPIDPVHIRRYFGDVGSVDETVMLVARGVPVIAAAAGADLERALQYGNHSSVTEHLPAIKKK